MNYWTASKALLACSLLLLIVGCDDAVDYDGSFGPVADVSDTQDEPCGDGICDGEEYFYSCPADCPSVGRVIERGITDGTLTHFPDDILTVDDPSTDTGRRVDYQGLLDEQLSSYYFGLSESISQVQGIDGFGTTAGAFFFLPSEADQTTVTSGTQTSLPGTSIVMGSLTEDGVEFVPVEVESFVDQPAIIARPMLPLAPGSVSFFAATSSLKRKGNASYMMDEPLYRVLHGDTPEGYEAVARDLNDAADALISGGFIDSRTDLVALTTFTVQNPIAKSKRIAEYVTSQPPLIESREPCVTKSLWKQCTVAFRGFRYMDEELRIDDNEDGVPISEYTLKAEVFIPLVEGKYGGTPYPTVIFGHGLGGKRQDGDDLAEFFAPEGIALVVIDAPIHGEHPTSTGELGEFDVIFTLFGITLDPEIRIDSRILRDGWRQSNYDKLALTEVLDAGLDADGDDVVDLDPDRIMYFGASLGAIQGPEFASLTDDTIANMFAVGGARVTDIVRKGDIFGPLVGLVLDSTGTKTETSLFYQFLQQVVDGGDPATFAPHVLSDRIFDDAVVPLAVQMSVPDEVVSNAANAYLVRSLGVPLIGRVAYPIPLAETKAGPLSQNHPSGVTAGALQTDWIWDEGRGEFVPATHGGGPASEEAIEYWTSFIESVLNGDAELVDPYPKFNRERPEESSVLNAAAARKSLPRGLDELSSPIRPFATSDD